MSDRRERNLHGWHGFDLSWWIFSLSFTVKSLRDIYKPRWLGLFLCRFNRHAWWLITNFPNAKWRCTKCKAEKRMENTGYVQ